MPVPPCNPPRMCTSKREVWVCESRSERETRERKRGRDDGGCVVFPQIEESRQQEVTKFKCVYNWSIATPNPYTLHHTARGSICVHIARDDRETLWNYTATCITLILHNSRTGNNYEYCLLAIHRILRRLVLVLVMSSQLNTAMKTLCV